MHAAVLNVSSRDGPPGIHFADFSGECRWSGDSVTASVLASRSKRASRSGSCGKSVGEDFNSDLAPEVRIRSGIDLAHATHADLGGDFIRVRVAYREEDHGKWLRL